MSTGGDFQSLPPSIIRAIAIFCKPGEVCSLVATSRHIQENLRISIVDPPFAKWRRRVDYTRPVQEIMRIPTFFHDRPYYAGLVFGIHTIQKWGPSTRFFILSKPGTMGESKKVRDDAGNEGTFVARVPSLSNRDNRVDILFEPNQTYFLWGGNEVNTTAQISMEAERFILVKPNFPLTGLTYHLDRTSFRTYSQWYWIQRMSLQCHVSICQIPGGTLTMKFIRR